ncbi:hypothetical protein SLA2020_220280 [Shorea laevis]
MEQKRKKSAQDMGGDMIKESKRLSRSSKEVMLHEASGDRCLAKLEAVRAPLADHRAPTRISAVSRPSVTK